MGFKKNVVKVDLGSYPHYLFLAPRKFGKTTFWDNLVKEAWGSEDKGLLISFGNEEGYHSLDNINYEVAKDWDSDYDDETDLRGFVQIIDDIIENNATYGLKGVCCDTLDTMVDVATKEVFRQHRKEKGTVCKSLNDAFAGYGRGKARLLELIDTQLDRLKDIGIAVFLLCHIKNKEKTDLMSGEKYEMITNNLSDDIFGHIADTAQMVIVGALDREIINGKIINENRVVYLRGTSTIDAGGRFLDLPDKIELSPKAFLEAFEIGVKNSMKRPITDKDIDSMKKAELEKREQDAKVAVKKDKERKENNEDDRGTYVNIIVTNFPNASDEAKKAAKTILAEQNCKKFTDEELSVEALKAIVDVLA